MVWEYTTSFEDFKAAQRLARRRSAKTRVIFFLFHRFLPVLAIFALAVLIWDMGFHHFSLPSVLGGLLFGLVWIGFYCPITWPFQLRRLYKAMKNGRPDSEPVELELADGELISRVPGLSEGRFRRAAITGLSEDEHVGLLWVTPKNFLLIPKHALQESGWQQVREWVGDGKLVGR